MKNKNRKGSQINNFIRSYAHWIHCWSSSL